MRCGLLRIIGGAEEPLAAVVEAAGVGAQVDTGESPADDEMDGRA